MYISHFKLCIHIHNDRENARVNKNFLKFGYGINYKYEGRLSHSKGEDLKLTMIIYDSTCQYLEK